MSPFVCQSCGAQSPSWIGKCPVCEEWNSYIEESSKSETQNPKQIRRVKSKSLNAVPIGKIDAQKDPRTLSGIGEFDRVLGGGILKGAVVLVAGEPGTGKSTLMLQLASSVGKKGKVLYVSGEESLNQIKVRAQRLSVNAPGLFIYPDTGLFEIEEQITQLRPDLVMIDSIQTLSRSDIPSAAGSVSQIKDCASYLVQIAKTLNIPVFLIGQVTKDGSVAGPRILEHMVDTVLYFEGENSRQLRILRAVKNRFGSTNEVGIFEMTQEGLKEIVNPSKILLEEGSLGSPGSVVSCAVEGSRPLMIEIQALVSQSKLACPRRVVTGLDHNRCSMIIGVLERKAGIRLFEQDIYLSVTSGLYVDEPAADLPAALAVVSCAKNKGIDPKMMIAGELGLTGEIRSISNLQKRLSEAAATGFTKALVPAISLNKIKPVKGIEITGVSNIREAIDRSAG